MNIFEFRSEEEICCINCCEILYFNGYKLNDKLYVIDVWFINESSPLTIEYDNENEFTHDLTRLKDKLNELII